VPFAYPNIAATYEVFDGPFGQKLGADISKKTGLEVLGFGDSGGFFAFTNSKRPIKSPDDMKGLKIRYAAGPIFAEIFTTLGANPVQMSFADLQPALSSGATSGTSTNVTATPPPGQPASRSTRGGAAGCGGRERSMSASSGRIPAAMPSSRPWAPATSSSSPNSAPSTTGPGTAFCSVPTG
jgi:hypothetical protein